MVFLVIDGSVNIYLQVGKNEKHIKTLYVHY